MFARETRTLFVGAVDAAKVSHIPAHSDAVREETCHASAEIHRLQITQSLQSADRVVSNMHEPGSANNIRAKRVLRELSRHRDDDVSCNRCYTAVGDKQRLRP